MSIGSDIYVLLCMDLHWWNYLMSGFMVCANDDYLRFMNGGKFRGFEL